MSTSQWSWRCCRDTNKNIIAAILPFRAWVKNKNHYNFMIVKKIFGAGHSLVLDPGTKN